MDIPMSPDQITSLDQLVGNAKETLDGFKEGAGGVPSFVNPGDPAKLVTTEMSVEDVSEWWKRIDRADARLKKRAEKWDILLDAYNPIVEKGPVEAKVNAHFRNVHSKIPQMFYKNPDVRLLPDGPAKDKIPNPTLMQIPPQMMAAMQATGHAPPQFLTMEDVVYTKQVILNRKMGRDGLKVNRLMDELLFDVLGYSGIGVSVISYQVAFRMKPAMEPAPPTPVPGSVLGLSQPPPSSGAMQPRIDPATGQQVMEPVPIFEACRWDRLSPKQAIIDDRLKSTRYDEHATYQGYHAYISHTDAVKMFKLTEEQLKGAEENDKFYKHKEDESDPIGDYLHVVVLEVKSSVYTDEVHPQAMHQLVLMKGMEQPLVWRPHPYQTFGPDGRLTEDSIDRFTTRILNVRDYTDSPFPWADSAFTDVDVKHLNTHRTQSVQLRDAAIGKMLADADAFEPEDVEKIKNGEVGKIIWVKSGALRQGADKIFAQAAQIHASPDDYRTAVLVKQDMDETLGISAVGSGTTESTIHSATEIANVQTAVAARNSKEQDRVIDFYLDGVRLIDSLTMRYATDWEWLHYTGQNGLQRMQVWNGKLLAGRFIYDIKPDSQLRIDTAQDRQFILNTYNIVSGDPMANRMLLLKRLARAIGEDPAEFVLNPANPMQAMQMQAQPPHGGGPVNKHQAAVGGGRPNAPGAPDHRVTQAAGPMVPNQPNPAVPTAGGVQVPGVPGHGGA